MQLVNQRSPNLYTT